MSTKRNQSGLLFPNFFLIVLSIVRLARTYKVFNKLAKSFFLFMTRFELIKTSSSTNCFRNSTRKQVALIKTLGNISTREKNREGMLSKNSLRAC